MTDLDTPFFTRLRSKESSDIFAGFLRTKKGEEVILDIITLYSGAIAGTLWRNVYDKMIPSLNDRIDTRSTRIVNGVLKERLEPHLLQHQRELASTAKSYNDKALQDYNHYHSSMQQIADKGVENLNQSMSGVQDAKLKQFEEKCSQHVDKVLSVSEYTAIQHRHLELTDQNYTVWREGKAGDIIALKKDNEMLQSQLSATTNQVNQLSTYSFGRACLDATTIVVAGFFFMILAEKRR